MLLADKAALITGGAKGMGRGMAVKFAEEGCAVAIADISMKEANELIAEISGKGGKAFAVKCDITSEQQVRETVGAVIDRFGKLDVLVNNAGGITASPPIEEMTEEEWDKALDLT